MHLWPQIKGKLGKQGRTSKWYIDLREIICTDPKNDMFTLKINLQQIKNNNFAQNQTLLNTPSRHIQWSATSISQEIVIGKKKKTINDNEFISQHYTQINNTSPLHKCQ